MPDTRTHRKPEVARVSRKEFLSVVTVGLLTVGLSPSVALASSPSSGVAEERMARLMKAHAMGQGASVADSMWDAAVQQATSEGEQIITDISSEDDGDGSGSYRAGHVTGATSGTFNTVAGQPESIRAIATYYVANGKITTVIDAWIMATATHAEHCSYSYTKLDGGQTLAVWYTVTLTNYANFNQLFKFYAEFYDDGSGWMNGGWA